MKKLRKVLPNGAGGGEFGAIGGVGEPESRPEAVSVNADPSSRLQSVQLAVEWLTLLAVWGGAVYGNAVYLKQPDW